MSDPFSEVVIKVEVDDLDEALVPEQYTSNVTNKANSKPDKAIKRKKKEKTVKTVKAPKADKPQSDKPTKEVPCGHCDKTFSCRAYLQRHMATVCGKRVCQYCEKCFVNDKALVAHLNKKHDPEEPYNCEFCGRTFAERDDIDTHVATHRGERPYECMICRKRFTKKNWLNIHRRTHGDEKRFECDVCGNRYHSKHQIRAHMPGHTVAMHSCAVCGKAFTRKGALSLHARIHAASRPHKCRVCEKGFLSKRMLLKHELIHRPGHLRHVCHVCFHTLPSQYHLQRHLVTHKKEGLETDFDQTKMLTKFQENSFPRNPDGGDLLGGEQDRRDTVKVFILEETHRCEECDQVFLGADTYGDHMKLHRHSETEHTCKICDKVFKQSYYLKLHTRTHTGEKPYECGICSKGFVTSSKLSRHMKTHTGEKKHECPVCHKYFSWPSYLRVHIRRHAKEVETVAVAGLEAYKIDADAGA